MKTLIAVLVCSLTAFGQGVRFDYMALGPKGPLPNVTITVCTGTATGTPCSPQATTFSDITVTPGTACSPGFQVTLPGSNLCQATSDALGNYGFWLAPGTYIYSVTGANITGKNYTLTVPIGTDSNGNVAITGTFTAGSFTNNLGVFAATTSAQLAGVISDETGSGPLVFANGGTIAPTSVTTGQIIQPAATALTIKDNQGGTRFSIPSGGVAASTLNNTDITGGSTLSGTIPYARLKANRGTALVTGDVGSLTNFGTTASVSAVSGTDSAGIISIASAGTGQVANGSFVLTFHDGTWTTAPVCVGNRAEGNGPNTATVATSTSATTLAFNFDGAAVAGVTYIFNFICVGKP